MKNSLQVNDLQKELTSQDSKNIGGGEYRWQSVFVKSWPTSGDADDRPTEENAVNFYNIGFHLY